MFINVMAGIVAVSALILVLLQLFQMVLQISIINRMDDVAKLLARGQILESPDGEMPSSPEKHVVATIQALHEEDRAV